MTKQVELPKWLNDTQPYYADIFGNSMSVRDMLYTAHGANLTLDGWMQQQYKQLSADNPVEYPIENYMGYDWLIIARIALKEVG
jgi:hypothetical protein